MDNHTSHEMPHKHDDMDKIAQPSGSTQKDPVCGMVVTPASPHHHENGDTTYYFCSANCRTKFIADPTRYLKTTPPPHSALTQEVIAVGTIYTCPMHPEIRQDHPGNCPKCGMTLEPVMPSLDNEENPELTDFTRRFWWTLPFTVIVLVLAMVGHRLQWFAPTTQSWIELVLSLPGVVGWRIIFSARFAVDSAP
jgi:Cu+-exporting ATPase